MSEKLIFPIGFDLEEGVKEASKEWKSTYQKQLQKAIDDKPLKVKIDFESKGIDTKEFKQWMALSREAEKLERERIKNAREWQKVADQAAMAETRRANATNESNARIERQNRKAEASERRKRDAVERTNEAYKRQGGYLQRLMQRMVAYASVAQAMSFLRNIREVTAQFELQRVALGSIIGDLNEANAMFEQIKAAAVKSPFQIKELVTYTKQLAAYKIETDELFETTQKLADISAGIGVGMERLVLAYGQIRATGYLRASEVRQLTEAGIPIVEELAKKMSDLRGETVSAAEVMGLISERAISFGMVKEVFDDMTSAGGMFYKMQEKQAETLAGQWSNLRDSISIMYEEIGNTESVNNAMKGMIGLIKSLAENWRVVGDVAVWSVGAAMGYAKVIKPISELVKKQDLLKKSSETYAKSREALHLFMQTGDKDYQREYQWQLRIARSYRQSANAARGFGGALKAIGSFIKANWVGMLITAVTALVSWLISARQEANRLNKELAKIGTEGALQADQSVRNFERLARAVSESADGSAKQTEALEEMKRAYGEFLPSQDKSIINLVREKDGYNAVTQAIREKIALQMHEQKLNTIASEYGSRFGKWEGKLKESPFFKDFSKEEISLIISDIKNAVNDGLIATTNDIEDNMNKVRDIIHNITGSFISQDNLQRLFTGGTLYKGSVTELIKTQEAYNAQIQEVESSMESATGSLGKYTQAYKDFKEELKDVTGTGEKFSFEWNESKTKAEIKAYLEFIGNLLAKEGIKFDIGEAIDFKGLYEALGDNYPQLKQVVAKIQKEYEKLIPTDITRLANDKLQEYANEVGISMDDVKEHLKTNEQSTENWAKGLKGAYESAEKKLAEYKKSQEAFSKQGAPFKDWSEDIEETTKEMKVLKLLMEFFKEFLSQSGGGKKANPRIALLNEELSIVEKIYKEYQELRKFMSEDDARARIADMFEDVNLTMLSQALSPAEMRAQLQKALDKAKKMGDKKQILELEYMLGKFDVDEAQREMGKNLKKLSDDLSRTKTAKEFFDRMLGMTGDKELSATLTLSVYGTTGDDLQRLMSKQVEDAFKNLPEGFDITKAMLGGGKFDYNLLESWIEKLPEQDRKSAQSIVENWRKTNQDIITDLYKTYEEFLSFEERKTRVVEKENAERMRIINSGLPMAEQEKLVGASQKRENKALADIAIEEFKASEDWAKSFEDLEHLATPTIERLMAKLKEFIDTQKDLTPEQLKTLTNEYKKLYDGLIARNPFKAMTDGIKEYVAATKDVKTAKDRVETAQEELRIATERKVAAEQNFKTSQDVATAGREYASAIKEYNKASQNASDADKSLGDALDAQKTALNKTIQGFNAASSAISNFGSIITDITEILGIAEDSKVGAFIKDLVKWLGVMASALGTVATIIAVIEAELAPLLAIAAGIAAIGAAISFFSNAKVRKANEEIKRQQELLDSLAYSYERLEKAQEKAFGSDYISNYQRQLENLQAQQEAYLKQADAERSKGKKADKDKIKEYEEQARDAADAIKDMYGSLSEHFLGQDLASAARDFATAWIDAYKEFSNTTDAMKEKFHDMIQNMVVESIAGRMMQQLLQPVFDAIDNYSKDGQLDEREIADIADMSIGIIDAMDEGMTGIVERLRAAGYDIRQSTSGLTGISKDIASASEESILGLAAGINTQNYYISQVPTKLDTIIGLLRGDGAMPQGSAMTLQDVMIAQNQFLSHLPTIAQHTAETVAECKQIVAETRRTADALDRVIKPDGTRTTYKMNVVTSYQG